MVESKYSIGHTVGAKLLMLIDGDGNLVPALGDETGKLQAIVSNAVVQGGEVQITESVPIALAAGSANVGKVGLNAGTENIGKVVLCGMNGANAVPLLCDPSGYLYFKAAPT